MKIFLGFILATVFWITLLAIIPMPPTEVRYDCSMAEFHPDFPPKVREECRRLRRDSTTTNEPPKARNVV